MTDIATLGLAVHSGPVEQAADALDKLSGAAGKAGRAAADFGAGFANAGETVKRHAADVRLARHEWVNLWRQFQDITVSLTSGQNPLTVLLQQGTQVYDVLASRRGGVREGVRALSVSLSDLVAPASSAAAAMASVVASTKSASTAARTVSVIAQESSRAAVAAERAKKAHQEQVAASARSIAAEGKHAEAAKELKTKAAASASGVAKKKKEAEEAAEKSAAAIARAETLEAAAAAKATITNQDKAASARRAADSAATTAQRRMEEAKKAEADHAKFLESQANKVAIKEHDAAAKAGRAVEAKEKTERARERARRAKLADSWETVATSPAAIVPQAEKAGVAIENLADDTAAATSVMGNFGRAALGVATHPLVVLTAAVGAASYAIYEFETQQQRLERSINGAGRAAVVTAAGLRSIGVAAARRGDFSTGEGIDAAAQLAATGRLGGDIIGQLVGSSKQFARAFGLEQADAVKELGAAFSEPVKGARALDERLGFLDATSLKLIQTLHAQGDVVGAQRALFAEFDKSLRQTTDATWGFVKAWESFKSGLLSPVQTIGGFIDQQFGNGGAQATLRTMARAQREQRDLQARRRSLGAVEIIESTLGEETKREHLANSFKNLSSALGDARVRAHMTGEQIRQGSEALALMKFQLQNWTTTAQRLAQDSAIAVREISARTYAEREAVAMERARLEAIRAGRTELETAISVEGERAKMLADASRRVEDRRRDAAEALELAKLPPLQRRQRENELESQKFREQYLPSASPVEAGFARVATASERLADALTQSAGRIGGATELPYFARAGAMSPSGGDALHRAIIAAEGTARRGNPYDEVLGYGQYGRPSKPLSSMTLRETYDFGAQVRARHGSSSALGAYQIVNTTRRAAQRALGLSDDEVYSSATQDRMADWIARKQGLGAWEGFKTHPRERAIAQSAMNGRGSMASNDNAPPLSRADMLAKEAAALKDRNSLAVYEATEARVISLNKSLQSQGRIYDVQNAALHENEFTLKGAVEAQRLLNMVLEEGATPTDKLTKSIAEYGMGAAEQARKDAEVAKKRNELIGERDFVRDSFSSTLGGALKSAAHGERFDRALEDGLRNVGDRMIDKGVENLTEGLFGGRGTMGGGLLGSLLGLGGGDQQTAQMDVQAAVVNVNGGLGGVGGGILGSLASKVAGLFGHNAEGTNYWPGGMSWVGERGPELVNLPRGASVIPNHAAMAMARSGQSQSGGGGVVVNLHNAPAGTTATARETTDARGNRRVDVMLGEGFATAVGTHKGRAAMAAAFGAKPMTVRR